MTERTFHLADRDPTTPTAIVARMWCAFEARDWTAAAALLPPDVVATWAASRERYYGRARHHRPRQLRR